MILGTCSSMFDCYLWFPCSPKLNLVTLPFTCATPGGQRDDDFYGFLLKGTLKTRNMKIIQHHQTKTGGYGLGVELPPGLQVTFIEEVSQTAQNWKTSGSNVELASKIQNWLLQRQKETHALVTWFLQIYLWGVSILHQQSFLIFHIHLPVALYLYPGLSPSLLLTSIRSLVAYINPSTQKKSLSSPSNSSSKSDSPASISWLVATWKISLQRPKEVHPKVDGSIPQVFPHPVGVETVEMGQVTFKHSEIVMYCDMK